MNNLALIVPTRGRPDNIAELAQSLKETNTHYATLIIVCDTDDAQLDNYKKLPAELGCEMLTFEREGKGMAKPLNKAVRTLFGEYDAFAFMGDDHRPRTANWDGIFLDTLREMGTGIVYGNDLHQKENLPTAVAMSADIVEQLNGMVPEGFIHMYLDNFWKKLGEDIGALKYLDDVIIEHLHPVWGTAKEDAGYREVNAIEIYRADKRAYDSYIASAEYADIVAVLKR